LRMVCQSMTLQAAEKVDPMICAGSAGLQARVTAGGDKPGFSHWGTSSEVAMGAAFHHLSVCTSGPKGRVIGRSLDAALKRRTTRTGFSQDFFSGLLGRADKLSTRTPIDRQNSPPRLAS
jgi:hypothetical protein